MDVAPERQLFSETRRKGRPAREREGRLSFAYFSLAKQRKVRPAAGEKLKRTSYMANPVDPRYARMTTP